MKELVYLNDKLIDAKDAKVSVFDTGLIHGIGLFETLRSYSGIVFRLDEHLDRMFDSAGKLDLKIQQSKEHIKSAINELLEANSLSDARIRVSITPGGIYDMTEEGVMNSTLIITGEKSAGYPPEFYEKGIMVVINDCKQNQTDMLTGHKTLNFFSRLMALKHAQAKKAGEALWFTTQNYLAEGCISNVFLVIDGALYTPPLDIPVLPGIVRQFVIELARDAGIECSQEPIVIKDIIDADEIFLTNSIMELMPVCSVEAHKIADGKPGPVYTRLHELYRQGVKREL